MLVTNSDHYHFNQEVCGELSVHRLYFDKPREFYCTTHQCVVGPTGYEYGHWPQSQPSDKYTTEGSWNFLCYLIKSMFDKIEHSSQNPEECDEKYYQRLKKREREIKAMRVTLVESHWQPIVTYSDISGIDYGKILKSIVKHNS